jgi:prolyl oligopeptidase
MYQYPPARKGDVVTDYHGTPVADPYRWMENPDDPELRAWLEAEQVITERFLNEAPDRDGIRARLTELWNFPRTTPPNRRGDSYFYTLNDGLQNQAVLYWQEGLRGEPNLLLDPNTLSEDGTVALVNFSVSGDGQWLAYALSASGSDQQRLRVRRVETGIDEPETLEWVRFTGMEWAKDNSGFYYSSYPQPGTVPEEELYQHNRLYFHRPGTAQADDTLIYERPDAPELNFGPQLSEDGCFLVLDVWHAAINRNRLYYRRNDAETDFVRLFDGAEAMYQFVGSIGDELLIHTDKDAPRGRIIAVDTANGNAIRTVIAEHESDVIDFAALVNNQLVVVYLHDAHHRLHRFNLDGTPDREIALPGIGSIYGLTGRQQDSELFVWFESFLYPPTVLRYDFGSDSLERFGAALTPDVAAYETQQVFYPSKDGTRVPMFLTHRKNLERSGETPTLLYGYGGFNVGMTPRFNPYYLFWAERGGIFAQANLRGGNEYGESWHQAGMLDRKQNVFDDFIAAGEWLVASGYTRPGRLAIMGGSNGGLLVAACMLQRPDLFGAVLCVVPVTDMLRFHKFTAGRYWTDEYGNAEENAEHFRFLYAYSPAHNVKPGTAYPPILIMTAESDDRVVPMHSLKFTAALQAATSGENPALLRFEFKAGHGFGKPTSKLIDEATDRHSFLQRVFGL